MIGHPEEPLSVRSQVALLDEAAIALNDDCLGFTWLAISSHATRVALLRDDVFADPAMH